MKTVIAHPKDALQEAAVTAILNALSVPYEVAAEEAMTSDNTRQPKGLLELNGTSKGLWNSQAELDQHIEDLREW